MAKPWPRSLVRSLHARIPVLQVGDLWSEIPNDGDRIRIEGIDEIDDVPFPMIRYSRADGREDLDPRMGAPMFMFGKLIARGSGKSWRPER